MSAQRKLKLISSDDSIASPSQTPLNGRSHFSEITSIDLHGWAEAVDDFLAHKRAKCEASTVRWYRDRLTIARHWFSHQGRGGEGVPISDFRARDLDRYLEYRTTEKNPSTGEIIADSTRRADAIAIKAFVKWCKKEGIMSNNPLTDYEIPRSDKPYIPTPKTASIKKLLAACQDRWSLSYNPDIKFMSTDARAFYKRRNYAILTGLISTGLRIGEMLALKVSDIDFDNRAVVVRKAKGNSYREVPFELGWVEPLRQWLKVRPHCSSEYLFFTTFGTQIGYKEYLHSFRKDVAFAGVGRLTLHMLRHFSADVVAKTNIKAASQWIGHTNIATTQAYLHKNIEDVREAVDEASPLRSVLTSGSSITVNKRSEANKRRRLV